MTDHEQQIAILRAALAAAEEKLARWESFFSHLRHDMRGALSPAMLMADRLAMSDDAQKQRAGTVIVGSIERVSSLLHRRVDDPPAEKP